MSANDAEKNIQMWKVKNLIKRLEAARGNGTSMISLIIRTYLASFSF
jgi:peptide chain release factor subunit 1